MCVKLYAPKQGVKELNAVLEGYEDGKLTVRWNGEPLTLEKSEVAQVRLRVEF